MGYEAIRGVPVRRQYRDRLPRRFGRTSRSWPPWRHRHDLGINSGHDATGDDISAAVWAYAPPVIRAVKAFGGATVTNRSVSTFPSIAAQAAARAVTGDFNGDGFGDMALVGGPTWTTVPVAFGDGNGGFPNPTNSGVTNFPIWARSAAHVVAADFNRDGRTDIALLAGSFTGIPIAFPTETERSPCRSPTNPVSFPGWAAQSGVKAVAGDFNADGNGDIALVGGSGWARYVSPWGTAPARSL